MPVVNRKTCLAWDLVAVLAILSEVGKTPLLTLQTTTTIRESLPPDTPEEPDREGPNGFRGIEYGLFCVILD